MDQEVAKTLGELELKLQELERELTTIGKRDAQPNRLQAPGKLIDEAVESDSAAPASGGKHAGGTGTTNAELQAGGTGTMNAGQQAGGTGTMNAGQQASGSGGINTWQQASAGTPSVEQRHAGGPGAANLGDERDRAVDSAFGGPALFGGEEVPAQGDTIERDSAFPVSETAYGEIATDSSQPSTTSFPSGVFSPATPGAPPPQPGAPPLPPPGPPLPPPGQPSVPPSSPPPVPPTPTPQPPPPQPIDRAELVRFKEKMQRTMEDLIDEYGKLLLPKPPA